MEISDTILVLSLIHIWYSNKTTLGKYNIWFITLHKVKCLKIALCNTERIRKILQIKV